jgi:hypothetical protein
MKPYADIGNFTTFPNVVLDVIMPACDPNEWRVVCATIRLTVGWHKESDKISLSQFRTLTGIQNKTNLVRAIGMALEHGYILRQPSGQSYSYRINREFELPEPAGGAESGQATSTDSVLVTSTDSVPVLVPNQYTQKIVKETVNKNTLLALEEPVGPGSPEEYPTDVREILMAFCDCWRMDPPVRKSKPGAYWLKAARDLRDACGAFGAAAVVGYHAEYKNLARPFSVATPASVVNMVRAWVGQHSREHPAADVPGLWVGG